MRRHPLSVWQERDIEFSVESLIFKFESKTDFTVKYKRSVFGQDKPFVLGVRKKQLLLGNGCILLVGGVRNAIFSSLGEISRKWHIKLSEIKCNL